jgi:hypothetical protein
MSPERLGANLKILSPRADGCGDYPMIKHRSRVSMRRVRIMTRIPRGNRRFRSRNDEDRFGSEQEKS